MTDSFGFYVMYTELAFYLKEMLAYDIAEVPYMTHTYAHAFWVFVLSTSEPGHQTRLSDCLENHPQSAMKVGLTLAQR